MSNDAIGLAEQISAWKLDALIERVRSAYSDALTASGNALASEDSLVSARTRRVALLVREVVAQFRVLPSSLTAPIEPSYVAVIGSVHDSRESVRAAGILHRVLTAELSAELRADPIDVGAAVMMGIMRDVSEAFDAMRSAAEHHCEYREQLDPAALREYMTAREGAVFQLLVKGSHRQQIADELHLSERTVKNHITGIGKKLGGQGRNALLQRARELQILVVIPVVAAASTLNDVIAAATGLG